MSWTRQPGRGRAGYHHGNLREALIEAALVAGKRLGMLATFEPSVAGMEIEFRDIAGAAGSAAMLDSHCVAGAMAALQSGDCATHDRLLAEAARDSDETIGRIVLRRLPDA